MVGLLGQLGPAWAMHGLACAVLLRPLLCTYLSAPLPAPLARSPGVAVFKHKMTQVTSVHKDKSGDYEPKVGGSFG